MRGTEDRPFTFPPGTTDDDKAKTFREVINEQVNMVRELLPKDKTPLFHFTMYSEMLPQYQRDPAAFDLPSDVIIVWPDDNDGHMRGLPSGLGRWKHGVYYHLAYLGGNLTKQLTHIVAPSTVAEQFDKIVKSGATEYMLVNVSELRDYVMGARMLADITWDAPAIYATPDPAGRYTAWWSREYFGRRRPRRVADAYNKYFAVLDTPDKLWLASDAIEELLDRLYRKVAGETFRRFNADTMALMQSRHRQLEEALAAEAPGGERDVAPATAVLPRGRSARPGGGRAADPGRAQVGGGAAGAGRGADVAARLGGAGVVGAVGNGIGLGRVSAVRPLVPGELDPHHPEPINPHRPYIQLRAFISSEGRGRLVRARRP